jgi:hypothetical protein
MDAMDAMDATAMDAMDATHAIAMGAMDAMYPTVGPTAAQGSDEGSQPHPEV